MAQYEKIKVRSKSGLLVTKWKDKKTGKVYSTKPNTNKDSPRGRVGVGNTTELKKIQDKNRQKLKPYLGLRNTNIGVGGNLKQQIRDIKVPNEKDPTEREEIDVTSKAYKDAVKSTNVDTTGREEIDVTSPQFKEAVTNPKKFLKKVEEQQNKNKKDNNKSETLKINKKDKNKFPGGKGEYSKFEKSGARQSSARNSVARQKYLKKKRDKLKAGK